MGCCSGRGLGGTNLSVSDVSFLLPTEQYDADPAKCGNPIYALAQRPERPVERPAVQDALPPTLLQELLDVASHGPLGFREEQA